MSPVGSLTPPALPETEAKSATDEGAVAAVAPAEGAKAEKPKVTNKPRPYDICVRVEGTAEKIKAKIDELVADGKGEILVVLGTETSLQPKLALTHFGQNHDLKGKYELVAQRAFTELTATSETETKRKVHIG